MQREDIERNVQLVCQQGTVDQQLRLAAGFVSNQIDMIRESGHTPPSQLYYVRDLIRAAHAQHTQAIQQTIIDIRFGK